MDDPEKDDPGGTGGQDDQAAGEAEGGDEPTDSGHQEPRQGRLRGKVRRGSRHLARELILQALYQTDIAGDGIERAIGQLCEDQGQDGLADLAYFRRSATNIWSRLAVLDEWIVKTSENWDLSRVAVIDRNILRLGIYELLAEPQLPLGVVINEAIELARRYGGEGSTRFINGVMDRVAGQIRKGEARSRGAT